MVWNDTSSLYTPRCKDFNSNIHYMGNKKLLLKAFKKAEMTGIEHSNALGNLGNIASKILGFDVIADTCSGNGIEFRKVLNDDVPDSNSTIRLEEIIDIINEHE